MCMKLWQNVKIGAHKTRQGGEQTPRGGGVEESQKYKAYCKSTTNYEIITSH
jgi:hypothetical protein